MAAKVFISYRRDDSRYQARMIHAAFCQVIPRDHVFMDVDSIRRMAETIPPDTTGRAQRAQMDIETFKGLLVINGGGAIALLSFLAAILNKPGGGTQGALIHALLWAVMFMMVGLVAAVLHNQLRRKCSLVYEQHGYHPPSGSLWGWNLRCPTVCFFSVAFMVLSLGAFIVGGLVVAIVGLCTL